MVLQINGVVREATREELVAYREALESAISDTTLEINLWRQIEQALFAVFKELEHERN